MWNLWDGGTEQLTFFQSITQGEDKIIASGMDGSNHIRIMNDVSKTIGYTAELYVIKTNVT